MVGTMEASSLEFRPVTTANADDFVALFEGPGGPKHCWCMVWRITQQEGRSTAGRERKPFILKRISEGTPVGLLGYDGLRPVAWVSVAPRDTHLRLNGPEARQGEVIWSLTCMFVPRKLRGNGIAHTLIAAAEDYARQSGASLLEAYPVAPEAPSYRFMGFVPAFERAGFDNLGMTGKRRHVMRKPLV